jgi:hypothetical protein
MTTADLPHPGDQPPPRVVVFGPHPVLTVTLEREGEQRESVHFHAAGAANFMRRGLGGASREVVERLLDSVAR